MDIRAILHTNNLEEARRLLKVAIKKYEKTAPRLSEWLEENVHDRLAVMQVPEPQSRRLRTSKVAERANK